MTVMEECRDLLNLSFVKRWVIAPMSQGQSVAEHTFRVMVLARTLAQMVGRNGETSRFLIHAMKHDLEEVYTGDVPGPSKDVHKPWPHPNTLLHYEIIVKVADSMETYTWWIWYGEPCWNHPMNPLKHNRDVDKIRHYTQEWPELWEAACNLMDELGVSIRHSCLNEAQPTETTPLQQR